MKNLRRILLITLVLCLTLTSGANAAYCPNCGFGASGRYCSNCGTYLGAGTSANTPCDMGIPYLGSTVYRSGDMNMVIFWVQTQLKATGIYYQGDIWDVTGHLGSQTIREIGRFMQDRGYRNHAGNVDQAVIDELTACMGSNLVPVYVGGFYNKMNAIMYGGSAGSMDRIYSNLIDMVPRVTTGARWIQVCLSSLGYYTGAIDGKYGEGTDQAVKRFQADYGFEQRDYVSLGVARAMLEACWARGYSLPDLP